jgi:hypothetical protein
VLAKIPAQSRRVARVFSSDVRRQSLDRHASDHMPELCKTTWHS